MDKVSWYTKDPHNKVRLLKFGTVKINRLNIGQYKNVGKGKKYI